MTELVSKLWYGTFETHSKRTVGQGLLSYETKRWYLNTIPVVVKWCGGVGGYLWLSRAFKWSSKVHPLFFVGVFAGMHLEGCRVGALKDKTKVPRMVQVRLGLSSILVGSCFGAGLRMLNQVDRCWKAGQHLQAVGFGAVSVWATLFNMVSMSQLLKAKIILPPQESWASA